MSFPDPAKHDFPEWVLSDEYFYYARDIISFGDPLTVENLKDAYAKGIFPWHMDGIPLPWFCPVRRAVLIFDELHIPESLARARRRSTFTFTIDKDFRSVIRACSTTKRPGQHGTWLTSEFIEVYTELHEQGGAHSVEVWDEDGSLVGGVYGVDAGGAFSGESMFYRKPNASKLALLFLFDHLCSRGSGWIDIQTMTPHMRRLGAKEISRRKFLARLREDQARGLELFHPK